jgi:predicted sulfurtransferase
MEEAKSACTRAKQAWKKLKADGGNIEKVKELKEIYRAKKNIYESLKKTSSKQIDTSLTNESLSNVTEKKNATDSGVVSKKPKSLGAWFPTATIRKVKPLKDDERCTISLFYHYVRPSAMSKERTDELKLFLENITAELSIGGRIRVALEGLNSTISGTNKSIQEFSTRLTNFGKEMVGIDFKYINNLPPGRAFKDIKVLPVKELVFYGVGEADAPLSAGGVHLEPEDYHAKMKEKDTVIIDVRNSYEAEIGKFVGQEADGGATYIDPKMRKSTDFKTWVEKPETQEKLKGKQVLLYCTGGVRCERASALINSKIGEQLTGVYQLKGGVEKYMQTFPDGGHWKGLNYVFDKREAIGVDSTAGVGGVVGGKKKRKKMSDADVLGRCCTCEIPWDRFIGKKKCYTCGVPVLMCDACMTQKIDKIKGRELEVRCPLCKEENITIPASETEWTDNGEGARHISAAPVAHSVLKWGGGHAREKKMKRSVEKQVTKKRKGANPERLPCRFGDECTRKGCWFSHPSK